MSDELSRIVAVLRHYDSVRIAQGVREGNRHQNWLKELVPNFWLLNVAFVKPFLTWGCATMRLGQDVSTLPKEAIDPLSWEKSENFQISRKHFQKGMVWTIAAPDFKLLKMTKCHQNVSLKLISIIQVPKKNCQLFARASNQLFCIKREKNLHSEKKSRKREKNRKWERERK